MELLIAFIVAFIELPLALLLVARLHDARWQQQARAARHR